MSHKEVTVSVTGAAGQIGYALLFRLASGEVFGPDVKVHLRMLELEQAMPALEGVCMELEDCAFTNLASMTPTSNLDEAFKGADWSLLVGSVPRKQGMERSDLLKINGGIFIGQGKAIAANAKADSKVLVVGNPCNTNAWICKEAAKASINPKNVFAMTMLDQNRAKSQLAKKAGVAVEDVKKLAIWGNHSSTMFPDYFNAAVSGASLTSKITDSSWLETDFVKTVQQRGAAIIKARGASSAASAANAALDTVKNLTRPTPEGEYFSVAVCSEGHYGIEKDIMFSYPIRSNGTDWEIVEGLEHNDFAKEKIKVTEQELISEREAVKSLL